MASPPMQSAGSQSTASIFHKKLFTTPWVLNAGVLHGWQTALTVGCFYVVGVLHSTLECRNNSLLIKHAFVLLHCRVLLCCAK